MRAPVKDNEPLIRFDFISIRLVFSKAISRVSATVVVIAGADAIPFPAVGAAAIPLSDAVI